MASNSKYFYPLLWYSDKPELQEEQEKNTVEENKEVEQEEGQDNGKANEQADEQEVDHEKPMIQNNTGGQDSTK